MYQKIFKKFSKRLCNKSDDRKYKRLYKKFRGDGFFIPISKDQSPLKGIIEQYFDLFAKKIKWIETQKGYLNTKKNFFAEEEILDSFDYDLNNLIKARLVNLALFKNSWSKFKIKYSKFIEEKFPFLLPFGYPVNFQEMRMNYENLKIKNGKKDLATQKMYFYRKIFEDGTFLNNSSRNDRMFRALINKILIELKDNGEFTQNLRVDLEDFSRYIRHYLKQPLKSLVLRFSLWEKRITRQQKFYQKILNDKFSKKYIVKMQKDRAELKRFVYKKEGTIFNFWSTYKQKWRKLFALETILTHEVGGLRNLSEDKFDIAQVFINRTHSPIFNKILITDEIYPYLNKTFTKYEKYLQKYIYLNTLLKEGEFSFTYFFIPSVVGLFCPDLSKRGKSYRKSNFKIAEKILASNKKFPALRYFSRISIFGRYTMDKIWKNYKRIKPQAGQLLNDKNQKKFKKLLAMKDLQLLYLMNALDNKTYQVLRYFKTSRSSKTVLYNIKNGTFYNYRNPDYFSYFELK